MNDVYYEIKEECLKTDIKNPLELIQTMMKKDMIPMHGPQHHILDGACFLAALHNAGMEFDLEVALEEMINRGSKMPGATCGMWGMCGSAASVGAALAIVHETGPLSSNSYYKDNLKLVSKALEKIAEVGGPRCCKRNAFLSIQTAAAFVNEQYGLEIPYGRVSCTFSPYNQQCIHSKCPFWKMF